MRFDNRTKKTALTVALLTLFVTAAFMGRRSGLPTPSESEAPPSDAAETLPAASFPEKVSTELIELPAADTPDVLPTDASPATTAPKSPLPKSTVSESTKMVAARPKSTPTRAIVVARADTPANDGQLEAQLLPPLNPRNRPTVAVSHYEDQLIDPLHPFDAAIPIGPEAAAHKSLPGSASVEYRLFDETIATDPAQRRYTEQGVAVTAQQETRGFGRLELRSAKTDVTRSDGFGSFQGDGYFNLTQRDFVLNDRWIMDNEIGHLRARVPELLSQGYRIRLPEPLVEGLSSEVRDAQTTLRVAGGTLGTYEGRTFPVFSTAFSSGNIAGVGGSTRFGSNWDGSAQYWQVNDAQTSLGTRSFSSAAGSVRYVAGENASAQASLLRNDGGALGLWFDGARRFGAWLNSAGVYRMDRELTWIDRNSPVQNDIEGAYWRAYTRSFRSSYSVGGDWYRTNVDNDPALSTRQTNYGFGNVGYNIDPTLSLGGFLSLGQDTVNGPGVDTSDTTVTVRGSGSKRFTAGVSSATLGVTDRSGDNPYTRVDANLDHQWNPIGRLSPVHTGIAYVAQSNSPADFTEVQLRGGFGWTRNRLSARVNAYLGNQSSDTNGSGRTMSLTAGVGWNPADAWHVGADFTYNHNALQVTNGVETRVTDKQVFISVRYDAAWGRPESAVGLTTGELGRGAVRGILFYDKNGNGLREPDEQGVPNVTVYLDRGFSVQTNADGEFSFEPVPSGQHEIRVNVANIPLPWALDEKRRIWADVHPRSTVVIEIPVTRIGPN